MSEWFWLMLLILSLTWFAMTQVWHSVLTACQYAAEEPAALQLHQSPKIWHWCDIGALFIMIIAILNLGW